MRRAMPATVPASANSASSGSSTPNAERTCAKSCAPRSESPPSMKKSARAGTAGRRRTLAHSAASAISVADRAAPGSAASGSAAAAGS